MEPLIVISNREPSIHEWNKGKIETLRPASGLVTALEPVLRRWNGLWIAHGSGSADRQTVNELDEVVIHAESSDSSYRLRRIWLTPDEEQGYYYGFANEGLWPLCHLAYTRPIFRQSDWEFYKSVNTRFSDAVPLGEIDGQAPLILVQDYHFALAPRMLRKRASASGSKARIGLFWHIPWPNSETFGIAPWHRDLLDGMLGADVIGFHTQTHCNNFIDSCDRYLEARIDRETFSVIRDGHETRVQAFPIGIEASPVRRISDFDCAKLKAKYGCRGDRIAVGVDRMDYTKGLLERFEAVERMLEKNPKLIGEFSLLQIASPSRSHIPAYRDLACSVRESADRINRRFGNAASGYRPVVLLASHHDWDEIQAFYQLGEVCLVTSLHDGMNLVAKEYVWCQDPERGSLVLSKFAGASRELPEAFIVNPYSIEETADAIASALRQTPEERRARMTAMRERIASHTSIHWAADLIRAVSETRTGPLR